MASPTPVLPEVGSTIVPPGLSFPSRSAASIRGRPIRSFTDPPGFRYSSLASSSGPPGGASFWSRTIGVLPTSSSAVGYSRGIGRKPSPGSMPEVAPAGEDHGAAGCFDSGDDLLVALRPARLDDRRHARLERDLRAVGEGDERVRGQHGAVEVVTVLPRLLDSDPRRVHAARLPAADPQRLEILGEHDCVRGYVLGDAPGEEQVAPDRLARLAAAELHAAPVVDLTVPILDEQSADDALVVPLAEVSAAPLPVPEDADRRLRPQRFQRAVLVLGRDHELDEPLRQLPRQLGGHRPMERDTATPAGFACLTTTAAGSWNSPSRRRAAERSFRLLNESCLPCSWSTRESRCRLAPSST